MSDMPMTLEERADKIAVALVGGELILRERALTHLRAAVEQARKERDMEWYEGLGFEPDGMWHDFMTPEHVRKEQDDDNEANERRIYRICAGLVEGKLDEGCVKPHGFCEMYGCSNLREIAAAIRARGESGE